ncbi:uncharacterized protein LOC120090747 [Benincasa hispida]|uniref:uncharacterized protein LOC120090747 n=1 Tax=Benincasa hispida TaxID=102211 RepID=UPI001901602A|nr:uncharacterized protein LOC120090747 [Benincasa hispida]
MAEASRRSALAIADPKETIQRESYEGPIRVVLEDVGRKKLPETAKGKKKRKSKEKRVDGYEEARPKKEKKEKKSSEKRERRREEKRLKKEEKRKRAESPDVDGESTTASVEEGVSPQEKKSVQPQEASMHIRMVVTEDREDSDITPLMRRRKENAPQGEPALTKIRPSTKKENDDMMMEMGFIPASTPLPDFTSVVLEHGWETFYQCLSIIIPTVVRAFYKGRLHGTKDAVIMKGCIVPFSARDINELYKMKDIPDASGNKIIDDPQEEKMEDALRTLTQSGTQWSVSLKGIKTLASSKLLPEARLWVYLVKRRIIPTSHDKTVSRDRVMAAYCIACGILIDVSHLIAAQAKEAAQRKQRQGKSPRAINARPNTLGPLTFNYSPSEPTNGTPFPTPGTLY